jgi:tetratricopeptide (TPR) repeat protein
MMDVDRIPETAAVRNSPMRTDPLSSDQGHRANVASSSALLPLGPLSTRELSTRPTSPAPRFQGETPVLQASMKLNPLIESCYFTIASIAESMDDLDRASSVYEQILNRSPRNVQALSQLGALFRSRDQFAKANELFERAIAIDATLGDVHGAMGHCYLMLDDLERAFQSYQLALNHLTNPSEPKLWYGIGILYDRWACYDNAEAAFNAALRNDPQFEKAGEIYFRLGIIYKQQAKWEDSLRCFQKILSKPPSPLNELDVQFQIGHCHEQQGNFPMAKLAYEEILSVDSNHAKALQQLGWLCHVMSQASKGSPKSDEGESEESKAEGPKEANESANDDERAVELLDRSARLDPQNAQTYYLLGRVHMAHKRYNAAHDAYQQAVYRDPRNPSFWCSIGVLYFQIRQYRDALDAYSRAIRINPRLSEVWYDLGTLYEACNNQLNDALDAYERASSLDPNNPHIRQRLEYVREVLARGGQTVPTTSPSENLPSPLHEGNSSLEVPPSSLSIKPKSTVSETGISNTRDEASPVLNEFPENESKHISLPSPKFLDEGIPRTEDPDNPSRPSNLRGTRSMLRRSTRSSTRLVPARSEGSQSIKNDRDQEGNSTKIAEIESGTESPIISPSSNASNAANDESNLNQKSISVSENARDDDTMIQDLVRDARSKASHINFASRDRPNSTNSNLRGKLDEDYDDDIQADTKGAVDDPQGGHNEFESSPISSSKRTANSSSQVKRHIRTVSSDAEEEDTNIARKHDVSSPQEKIAEEEQSRKRAKLMDDDGSNSDSGEVPCHPPSGNSSTVEYPNSGNFDQVRNGEWNNKDEINKGSSSRNRKLDVPYSSQSKAENRHRTEPEPASSSVSYRGRGLGREISVREGPVRSSDEVNNNATSSYERQDNRHGSDGHRSWGSTFRERDRKHTSDSNDDRDRSFGDNHLDAGARDHRRENISNRHAWSSRKFHGDRN